EGVDESQVRGPGRGGAEALHVLLVPGDRRGARDPRSNRQVAPVHRTGTAAACVGGRSPGAMLSRDQVELIQQEIDGANTPEGSAAFRSLIEQDPEARAMVAELRRVAGVF